MQIDQNRLDQIRDLFSIKFRSAESQSQTINGLNEA